LRKKNNGNGENNGDGGVIAGGNGITLGPVKGTPSDTDSCCEGIPDLTLKGISYFCDTPRKKLVVEMNAEASQIECEHTYLSMSFVFFNKTFLCV
jgi:hypothetical protein